ncbi:MAG: sulfite exporter TauE/SafE family protein [Dehalococcoidia bacterium]|nr:sulfite exporter TauE/SafE family protein [Dehalococcoidia bacterium]
MNLIETALLLLLGLFAGAYGTVVGAGGGFIIVPALAWVPAYAEHSAEAITGVSLVAVVCSAVSAVIAYSRQRRIDVGVALTLGVFALPGSVLGRILVSRLDRRLFEVLFGALLVAIAVYLVVRRPPQHAPAGTSPPPWGVVRRQYVVGAHVETVDVDLRVGALVSFVIGVLAALFGVGGGLMMTPSMVALMSIPASIATATSQLYLLTTSAISVAADILNGGDSPLDHLDLALPLALGVVLGAQAGAALSRRLSARWIIRLLAAALGMVGARLMWAGLGS